MAGSRGPVALWLGRGSSHGAGSLSWSWILQDLVLLFCFPDLEDVGEMLFDACITDPVAEI